jgi:hypothetical protein
MIVESKLMYLGCALALIVGAALVSPLLILHTAIDPFAENPPVYPNPQSSRSQIAANLTNIHLALGNMTMPKNMSTLHYTPSPDMVMATYPTFSGLVYIAETKYLNDNQNIPDSEVDFFCVQLSTDNGTLIANASIYVGTAYTRSFNYDLHPIDCNALLHNNFGSIFGGGGSFERIWSIGTTIDFNREFSGTINQTTVDMIKNSQTLSITLSRIGTITVRGNSTVVSTSDAGLIETVMLTKQGDSFFYNQDGSNKPIPLSITESIF